MMKKYVSAVAGFAAVTGVVAQLEPSHPVIGTEGFKDACHQDGHAKKGPDYPCNTAVAWRDDCKMYGSFEAEQECLCAAGWYADNEYGCLNCKLKAGLAAESGYNYSRKNLDKAFETYCALEKPTESYSDFFKRIENEAGPYPELSPGEKKHNVLGGKIDVELYWTPSTTKPDLSHLGNVTAPTGTVALPASTILAVATTTAAPEKAAADKPKYPANSTSVSASLEAVHAEIKLVSIVYDCTAQLNGAAGVTWHFSNARYESNTRIESYSVASLSVDVFRSLPNPAFCGCIEGQLITGQNFIAGKVEGRAGYTAVRSDEYHQELVVDLEYTSSQPLVGASPNSWKPGFPALPANVSPAAAKPASKKENCATGPAGAKGSAATKAHAAVNAAVESTVSVSIFRQGENEIYVPTSAVKNNSVVPAGASEGLPDTVPAGPASAAGSSPAEGSRGSAPGSAPAAGVAPASGASPADSAAGVAPSGSAAGAFPAAPAAPSPFRPAGTGVPVPGSARGATPVKAGAAASMSISALAVAAGLMVAVF